MFNLFKNINKQKSSIVINKGKNNKIICFDNENNITEVPFIPNLIINFYGSNNCIKIHQDTKFPINTVISCSQNNKIFIDKTKEDINMIIPFVMSEGSELHIGKNFSCGLTHFQLHREPNLKITVGDNCMFSENVYIKPSDGHTIYDKNNKIINKPENIIIGDHVWLCRNVMVLKGANIPNNSVVALSAVYTKTSNEITAQQGTVYAGIPAKAVRYNINWDRAHTVEFENINL